MEDKTVVKQKTLKIELQKDGTYKIPNGSYNPLIFNGEIRGMLLEFICADGLVLNDYLFSCILKINGNEPYRVQLEDNLLYLPEIKKGMVTIAFCAYKKNSKNEISEMLKWQGIQYTIN